MSRLAGVLPICAVIGAVLGACVAPADAPRGEPFVAVAADFQDFRDWPSFELPSESVTASHLAGTRRLYFDRVPPSPGAPFPVGTILVKAVEDGAPTGWEIHAMVKRGGGFNVAGASGWEFFDLAISERDDVIVMWRGEGPPPGFGYPGEGEGEGQCNGCHSLVPDRDFVFERVLFD